ncbi:transposase [Streptomyces sp. NPDC005931]|uniref:transposase n=1 Tax=Streptomyces sp. NPDC005931 TaxID=3364737 RepID=UPI0036CF4F20
MGTARAEQRARGGHGQRGRYTTGFHWWGLSGDVLGGVFVLQFGDRFRPGATGPRIALFEVLVWDNYSHHVDAAMRELIAKRLWLTVFSFPPYSPDLNPAERWAHLKKRLGNLTPCSIDDLVGLVSTRLKPMEYAPTCSTGSSPRPD